MEERLKQRRNKLFLRVTLILLTVWLALSATYCVIRLLSEKTNAQNRLLANVSYAKQYLSANMVASSRKDYVYITDGNLLEFKDYVERDDNSQIVVIDPETGDVLADTAGKIRVVYSFGTEKGTYPDDYGTLDYNALHASISDAQMKKITALLQTPPADGKTYELVCTRFFAKRDRLTPMEVSIMLTQDGSERFSSDNIVETFPLTVDVPEGALVFVNGSSHLNIIPKRFFLRQSCNIDALSLLTDEQKDTSFTVVPIGTGEYIYYAKDYFYLSAFTYDSETGRYESHQKLFLAQFAQKINLLRSCGTSLAAGVAIMFAFFLVIDVLLCLMIWTTVRMQILQESKRADLTNALAHDIKTPLFVISGYAYSLKEDIDAAQRGNYLDKIIQQTEQIDSLVHKMLNLSKLDSYQMTLNRSDFDLYGLVEEIIADYPTLPDGKSFTLTHTGDSTVNADRELLRTAIQNLTDNAVKYSLSGSNILVSVEGTSLRIDNPSEPLDKATLRKIWQPYVRGDKSRHRKGNGLGLSIVKSIFDLHGAKYSLAMKDGHMILSAKF